MTGYTFTSILVSSGGQPIAAEDACTGRFRICSTPTELPLLFLLQLSRAEINLQLLGRVAQFGVITSLNQTSTLKSSVKVTFDFVYTSTDNSVQPIFTQMVWVNLLYGFRAHSKTYRMLWSSSQPIFSKSDLSDNSDIMRFKPRIYRFKCNILIYKKKFKLY